MSLVDVFGKEDRTEVKFSEFFALVKQAAQYETLMNAVNCDVPHRFIRETMTGKKEKVPEIPEKKEAVLGVVDYLRKHYPQPEGSREVEVEFLEGYDSIEGPDGSMGFGVFVPTEEKIYIADDLPGGEESMIETVAHEWKHWLQYCNDEAYDEEEAEDFARQIVEEFL